MGLLRKVESRVESAVGAGPAGADPGTPRPSRPDKGAKLYVQPAELARKLVKEMEDHKVVRPERVLVCNRYTVFLCARDGERLGPRREEISMKLARHLAKHARAKKYEVPGEISVAMVVDADLDIGRFGILAERVNGIRAESDEPDMVPSAPEAALVPETPRSRKPNGPARVSAATEIIRPADAEDLGLARQTIVLRAGNRVREYTKGRVFIGRGRDADFRVDDPNVSRRHAVIHWVEGRVVVEDLGSTNGTMVNGYPVNSSVVAPDDVIVIGGCRISVETR